MRQQNKPDEKVPFWEWIARVHMFLKNVWQMQQLEREIWKCGKERT